MLIVYIMIYNLSSSNITLTYQLSMIYTDLMTKRKVLLVLTEEMHAELKALADKRGASLSGFVRVALAEYLADLGIDVNPVLPWGGARDRGADAPPPDA